MFYMCFFGHPQKRANLALQAFIACVILTHYSMNMPRLEQDLPQFWDGSSAVDLKLLER